MRIGTLGDIVFETSIKRVQSIDDFATSSSARYEDHEVVGGKPMSEFCGSDLRSFSFNISLRDDLGADIATCRERLQSYIDNGNAVRLTIGKYNLGRVTVRSVSETWSRLDPRSGKLVAVELSVQLKEYI